MSYGANVEIIASIIGVALVVYIVLETSKRIKKRKEKRELQGMRIWFANQPEYERDEEKTEAHYKNGVTTYRRKKK